MEDILNAEHAAQKPSRAQLAQAASKAVCCLVTKLAHNMSPCYGAALHWCDVGIKPEQRFTFTKPGIQTCK